jgi:hypothetical protein
LIEETRQLAQTDFGNQGWAQQLADAVRRAQDNDLGLMVVAHAVLSQKVDEERQIQILIREQWLVLNQDDSQGRTLLITQDVIAHMPYNGERRAVTWERSSLRHWLNNEFYESLPEVLRNRLLETNNQNPNNPKYHTFGGRPTNDRVFLLSLDEVRDFFTDDMLRIARDRGRDDWWWLRSPGVDSLSAATVDQSGDVDEYGHHIDFDAPGVRPALWVTM